LISLSDVSRWQVNPFLGSCPSRCIQIGNSQYLAKALTITFSMSHVFWALPKIAISGAFKGTFKR
jgi:hypothetical protein